MGHKQEKNKHQTDLWVTQIHLRGLTTHLYKKSKEGKNATNTIKADNTIVPSIGDQQE